MKTIRWLDLHIEETVLVFLLIVIAVVELLQVVCRNIPFVPALTWAEELCRFAWIATVFLSLPYTVRNSNMLRVSVLIDSLPDHLHNLLNIIVDIVCGSMMTLLAANAFAVLLRTVESGETSPAMLWPMWIMYLIVLIGLAAAVLRSIQMVVIHIIHFNERPITYIEEQMEAEAAEEWVRPAVINLAEQAPVVAGVEAVASTCARASADEGTRSEGGEAQAHGLAPSSPAPPDAPRDAPPDAPRDTPPDAPRESTSASRTGGDA